MGLDFSQRPITLRVNAQIKYDTWREALSQAPHIATSWLFSLVMLLYFMWVLAAQAHLLKSNLTTWELEHAYELDYLWRATNVQSKDFYNPKSREFHNPFDKGFVNNVMTVLFNRQAPVAWSHIQSSKGNE